MINKLLLSLYRFNTRMDKYAHAYGVALFALGIITLLITLFSALVWSLDGGMLIRGILLTVLGFILTNEKETKHDTDNPVPAP